MGCNLYSRFRRRLVSLLLDSGVMSVVLRVELSFNPGSILIPSSIGAKFSGSTAYAKQALSIPFVLIHDSGETSGLDNVSRSSADVRLIASVSGAQKYTNSPSHVNLGAEFLGDIVHDPFPKLCSAAIGATTMSVS